MSTTPPAKVPERDARRAKIDALRAAGVDPYPVRFDRTANAGELHDRYDSLADGEETDVVVRVDGTQEGVEVSSTGQVRVSIGRLSSGRHRLEISASDLQETKNSENASAFALPNTRTVHTAFTVGATG